MQKEAQNAKNAKTAQNIKTARNSKCKEWKNANKAKARSFQIE